jgi:hypothetical protein
MNSEKLRALASTAALLIFLAVLVYNQFDWLGLMIPGAILMWYGFVGATLLEKTGARNRKRSSLN